MAIDPICGMTVDEATTRSAERDNQTFYFCSEHCREKFLGSGLNATPKQHAHNQAQETGCEPDEPGPRQQKRMGKYFCPMCKGVESDNPGDCPKCGMALERSLPLATKEMVIYTYPMHPEVEQEGPGVCPKCGMDLEPKTIQRDGEDDDSELRSMTRRLWVAVVLTIPVLLLAMLPMLGVPVDRWLGATLHLWLQLVLSTPVVFWGGWPFFL